MDVSGTINLLPEAAASVGLIEEPALSMAQDEL